MLVGRNFVSGICKLKPKTLKPKFKNLFLVKNPGFFSVLQITMRKVRRAEILTSNRVARYPVLNLTVQFWGDLSG